MEILNQERDVVSIITSVNLIKDKMCTLIDRINEIETEYQSFILSLPLFDNTNVKRNDLRAERNMTKTKNHQKIENDSHVPKSKFKKRVPVSEKEIIDEVEMIDQHKTMNRYRTNNSKFDKKRHKVEESSILSQSLDEIRPNSKHKQSIKSINKIVENEMQNTKPRKKKKSSKKYKEVKQYADEMSSDQLIEYEGFVNLENQDKEDYLNKMEPSDDSQVEQSKIQHRSDEDSKMNYEWDVTSKIHE